MNRSEAQAYERASFDLAASIRPEKLIYTPSIMLLNDGYACQPDALTLDFSTALEIKSLTDKNFELIPERGSLPHKYKRITYKYYLANPHLELLVFFFVNRSSDAFFFREITRPQEYSFQIKRAHNDATKIKGDYHIIDLNKLAREDAKQLLSRYINNSGAVVS